MNYINEKAVLSGRIRELERDYAALLRQNKKLAAEVRVLTDELIYREKVMNKVAESIKSLF